MRNPLGRALSGERSRRQADYLDTGSLGELDLLQACIERGDETALEEAHRIVARLTRRAELNGPRSRKRDRRLRRAEHSRWNRRHGNDEASIRRRRRELEEQRAGAAEIAAANTGDVSPVKREPLPTPQPVAPVPLPANVVRLYPRSAGEPANPRAWRSQRSRSGVEDAQW